MGKETGFWNCRAGSYLCLVLTGSLTLAVQAAVGGVAFYISLGMGITVLALGIFTLAKVGPHPTRTTRCTGRLPSCQQYLVLVLSLWAVMHPSAYVAILGLHVPRP